MTTARRVWNGAIDRRPAVIARCTGSADVLAAIAVRAEHGLPASVRGGGHSIPGYSIVDDGLVIDCTPMKGIHVNPAAETAIAQPGLDVGRVRPRDAGVRPRDHRWRGVRYGNRRPDRRRRHRLAAAGTRADVGQPALRRPRHRGRPTAAREPRRARRSLPGRPRRWRNFGIVTLFEYRLHRVGPLLAGIAVPAGSRGGGSCATHAISPPRRGDEVTITIALITAPPAPFVPEALHGQPTLAVVPCYVGASRPALSASPAAGLRPTGGRSRRADAVRRAAAAHRRDLPARPPRLRQVRMAANARRCRHRRRRRSRGQLPRAPDPDPLPPDGRSRRAGRRGCHTRSAAATRRTW